MIILEQLQRKIVNLQYCLIIVTTGVHYIGFYLKRAITSVIFFHNKEFVNGNCWKCSVYISLRVVDCLVNFLKKTTHRTYFLYHGYTRICCVSIGTQYNFVADLVELGKLLCIKIM